MVIKHRESVAAPPVNLLDMLEVQCMVSNHDVKLKNIGGEIDWQVWWEFCEDEDCKLCNTVKKACEQYGNRDGKVRVVIL